MLHLEALQRAAAILGEQQSPALPVHIHIVGMKAIWRRNLFRDAVLLKVSEGFLNADGIIWQAIIQIAIGGRDRAGELLIQEYLRSEEFSEVLDEMESYAATDALPARGRAHDLDESFARVNTA